MYERLLADGIIMPMENAIVAQAYAHILALEAELARVKAPVLGFAVLSKDGLQPGVLGIEDAKEAAAGMAQFFKKTAPHTVVELRAVETTTEEQK